MSLQEHPKARSADRSRQSSAKRLRFLALLLDSVEQAVIATDCEGRILHWNRFAEKLYGWSAKEVAGRTIPTVLLPEEARERAQAAISLTCERERSEGEWVLRRRDGTAIPVRVATTRIKDERARVVGVVGVSWDISEQRRMQEELHQSEIRLRMIAEQLPAMAWTTDARQKILWNQGASYRKAGVDRTTLIGKTIAEAVEGSDAPLKVIDAHRRALDGETVTFEGGGRGVVTQSVVQPFRDPDGRVTGTIGVSLDITDRKRADESLRRNQRLLAEAEQIGNVGSFEMDIQTKFRSWSDELFRILGFLPQEFAPNGDFYELVHPDDRARVIAAYERALERGGRMQEMEYRVVRHDGTERVLRSRGEVICDSMGRPHRLVGVVHDITDRKGAEDELRGKRAELEALSRRLLAAQESERRSLARELHDDFGQFLTAIRLNLEAARRGTTGEAARHLAESLLLVDQAVDRVRSLALELRPAILDDLGLVAALRWLVKRQSEHAGFEGRVSSARFEARLPTSVETCSFRLVQEALTNVVRHAHATRVDVELEVVGEELRIVVRDDGRGFDVRAARQRASRGDSLGLLSMHERATLAGGQLEITSLIDKGTTIDARIPLTAEGAP